MNDHRLNPVQKHNMATDTNDPPRKPLDSASASTDAASPPDAADVSTADYPADVRFFMMFAAFGVSLSTPAIVVFDAPWPAVRVLVFGYPLWAAAMLLQAHRRPGRFVFAGVWLAAVLGGGVYAAFTDHDVVPAIFLIAPSALLIVWLVIAPPWNVVPDRSKRSFVDTVVLVSIVLAAGVYARWILGNP